MDNALPRRTPGAPRTWSLCMTSENHGTVGPAGCTFSHAPEKHERVLVVEAPAGTRAPVAEFKGYVDGEPAVTWFDRDNMPRVGTKLFAAPVEVQADQAAAVLPTGHVCIADLPRVEITLRQAKELVATFGGHDAEISVFQRPAAWADMDDGLYAFFSDYPDEGSMYLGPTDVGDDLAMNGEPAPAEPTDEMIVAALHACAIDTHPSIYGFPELQVSATNVPGIRAVYIKIAAAMQASTSGERQEGGTP